MAEGAGFEPACDCSQTDFKCLSVSFHGCHAGAFECHSERQKWRNGAGLMAALFMARGFGENGDSSTFCGYLLARC